MSRRTRWSDEQAAMFVDEVMRWGYYVVEFSPYHIRIQDAVDFWPTQGRWRDPKGFRDERSGVGLNSLQAYLRENVPLP